MDFVMNHGGLFISIGVITLLALIGYYADKKDSKNKNNVINTSKSTASSSPDVFKEKDNSGVISDSALKSDVDDKTFSFDSTFYSPVQDSESLVSTDGISSNDSFMDNSEPESYDLNSFENVEMSLEDLEKKNYEKIASASDSASADDYCYDDLDDAPISIVSVPDVDLSNDSVNKQFIELDSNNTDLVDQQFLNLNVNNGDIVEEQSIDLSPISSDNSDLISSVDNDAAELNSVQNGDYHFDGEVQSEAPEIFDVNVLKNSSENVEDTAEPDSFSSNDSQVIPEIDDSGVVSNEYDLNNSTDDVWKF